MKHTPQTPAERCQELKDGLRQRLGMTATDALRLVEITRTAQGWHLGLDLCGLDDWLQAKHPDYRTDSLGGPDGDGESIRDILARKYGDATAVWVEARL